MGILILFNEGQRKRGASVMSITWQRFLAVDGSASWPKSYQDGETWTSLRVAR